MSNDANLSEVNPLAAEKCRKLGIKPIPMIDRWAQDENPAGLVAKPSDEGDKE